MSSYIPDNLTYPQAVEHIVNNRLQAALGYLEMIQRADSVSKCHEYANNAYISLRIMRGQLKEAGNDKRINATSTN